MVIRSTTFLPILALTWSVLLFTGAAHAKDNGQYENVDQATRDWVAKLQATGSQYVCCSLTDGQILGDQDWDYGKNEYRVFVTNPYGHIYQDGSTGKWFSVPADAIVQTFPLPRRVGHALVWVSWSYDENGNISAVTVKCFLSGGGV